MYRNRKHLTLSDRIAIETGIFAGLSFKKIAEKLERHPSTIAHEVKENRTYSKGNFPRGKDCAYARKCVIKHVCTDQVCDLKCSYCREFDCRVACERYKPMKCDRVNKAPYVCNRCEQKRLCTRDRYFYSAKFADAAYNRRLSDSRSGIRLDEEELKKLDSLITNLVKKGQPLSHIYAEHENELSVSLRSLYNYIDAGALTIKNIDLRRKTSYRPRRKKSQPKLGFQNQEYRQGRTYDDFEKYMAKHPTIPVVEMDTVKGVRESGKRLLTMIFRENNIMLLFLMPDGTADSVINIFDLLTDILDLEVFQRLFPVILTDNGSEFKRVEDLEYTYTGERRTRVFYCDPQASWQKPHIEKNHEFIRYVIPRGNTLNPYTDADMTLLMNHINSVKRKSLKNQSPYEKVESEDEDMEWFMELLGMHIIPPDDVHLKPDLFKK